VLEIQKRREDLQVLNVYKNQNQKVNKRKRHGKLHVNNKSLQMLNQTE
jgi:hypothetical protein